MNLLVKDSSNLIFLLLITFSYSCSNSNDLTGLVSDFEGNEYKTILIGDQEWMAENLRATFYSNGDKIPNVIGNEQWNMLTSGAWSFYNNDDLFDMPYGKLYNWYAVNDERNLCPKGWSVPSASQWNVLADYLGDAAGGKMKATVTKFWNPPNRGANNESGFSGVPGGERLGLWYYDSENSGSFQDLKDDGIWWASNSVSIERGETRVLMHSHEWLISNRTSKKSGFSVRCIKQ